MDTMIKLDEVMCVLSELEGELADPSADGHDTLRRGNIASLLARARQAVADAGRALAPDVRGLLSSESGPLAEAPALAEGEPGVDYESMLSLLENSFDAIYRRNLVTDRYDYISPVIEQITGFAPDEFCAMKFDEVTERIHPDDRQAVQHELEFVKGGGRCIVEYRFRGKDGSYRWLADSLYVLAGQGVGQPCRIGMVRDVSGQKETEEALQRSEDRYRSFVEMAPDAIFINAHNRIVFMNQAGLRMFGASSPDQVLGKTPYDLTHPDYHQLIRERIDRQLEGESAPLIEEKILRLDGSIIDVEVAAAPFATDDGTAIQVILRDITQRKQAEAKLLERQQQLAELNRTLERRVAEETRKNREKDCLLFLKSRQAELGEMIGNIAHQWRQPLNTIGLHVQDLAYTWQCGGLGDDYLDNTVASVMQLLRHMSQTIDDFRNFLRPEREVKQFSIGDTLDKTLSLVAETLKLSCITVAIERKGELFATGNPNEFVQVLLNLLNNAKDVLVERRISQPRISVTLERRGKLAVVTVADNGGGITEDPVERIFDPYYSTKQGSKGTGLGLYIAKAIVEKSMNGRLSVRNTGEGAEFRIEV